MIPPKLLTKIRAVNMGTMVKINESNTRAGGKALTVMKLKELGSKAGCKARGLFEVGGMGTFNLTRQCSQHRRMQ